MTAPLTPAAVQPEVELPELAHKMTWRELLIAVTEELRFAPAEALDKPVRVQLVGRLSALESVSFDPDETGGLMLYPWLVTK